MLTYFYEALYTINEKSNSPLDCSTIEAYFAGLNKTISENNETDTGIGADTVWIVLVSVAVA